MIGAVDVVALGLLPADVAGEAGVELASGVADALSSPVLLAGEGALGPGVGPELHPVAGPDDLPEPVSADREHGCLEAAFADLAHVGSAVFGHGGFPAEGADS